MGVETIKTTDQSCTCGCLAGRLQAHVCELSLQPACQQCLWRTALLQLLVVALHKCYAFTFYLSHTNTKPSCLSLCPCSQVASHAMVICRQHTDHIFQRNLENL